MKKKIFSGVQPTGNLHLGNYLGAIKNFVNLQSDNDCIYCVVDLHAITIKYKPEELRLNTLEIIASFLAAGLDYKKSILFNQSSVSPHAEFAWILNCVSRIGWMNRMTQFKEKAGEDKENASVGLFVYPTLMAADILLYDADLVPVGEDQKQHLELARDIAQQRINSRFSKGINPILKVPKPFIMKEGAKIMSLLDGTNKMSKSDPNEGSRIGLLDTADTIRKKIKKAKTDQHFGLEFENPNRPESNNLLGIYSIVTNQSREIVTKECFDIGWGKFKPLLTDALIASLLPIQQKYNALIEDRSELNKILKEGTENANKLSGQTLQRVKQALGFLESINF